MSEQTTETTETVEDVSPKSWKCGVMVVGESKLSYNALRFATEAEAKAYGENLAGRWFMVVETVPMPSEDEPNYTADAAGNIKTLEGVKVG